MAGIEPLTKARLGDMSDSPAGGLYDARIVNELSVWTTPAFNTPAERDAAYSARVANGTLTMRNGLHCTLNGWMQTYSNGVWRFSEGVINVPDRAARDGLAGRAYSGMLVHQIDRDLTLRWIDGGWQLVGSFELYSNNMGAGNNIGNVRWAGYPGKDGNTDGYGWFAGNGTTNGLGSKIRIPADGVSMNVTVTVAAQVFRDGSVRCAVDVINGPTARILSNGARTSNSNAEGKASETMVYNHTGLFAADVYMEVVSNNKDNLADFYFPKTKVTCSPIQ
jgi:hypothetical protein